MIEVGSERFRFGLFEFDGPGLELRREGVLVHLQSQPAQVLACLIERAGQVVSRDDLRKAIWDNETFVDFERGLNFCISQVRSALQDDSTNPRYIRTVPKKGYQFIAPVCRVSFDTSLPAKTTAKRSTLKERTAAVVLVLCAAAVFAFIAYRSHARTANQPPILAVLRFDNETGDPGMTRFSDALTDNVVEQLTSGSQGRYSIIGNAQILRLPREQRDLNAIASSLRAGYVVLGEVQSNGSQVRVLAHLIRLPDQTHVWVVRLDRTLNDPLDVESEAAQRIAGEFSGRIVANLVSPASPPSASH